VEDSFLPIESVAIKTYIAHNRSSDLILSLTSPQGTTVILSNRRGGENRDSFNGTIWSDNSRNSPETYIFNNSVVSDLAPEESFSSFQGEIPNGIWTLTVEDSVDGEKGLLMSWFLVFSGKF